MILKMTDTGGNWAKRKVTIVEDDSEIRSGFQMIINSSENFVVIGSFSSGEEFLANLDSAQPDIVLMDIKLPGINGIETVRVAKEKYPGLEIMMVTVFEDSDQVFEALKAGASGYLSKGTSYSKLLESLDELVRGGSPMSTKIARLVINNLRLSTDSPLTKREATILQLLAEGKTYYQMAEELYVSRDTVKTHLKHIYAKLYVKSRAEAVAKASKQKLI
jgi:DNA-binding NarL/FixJ family response regulator